ncbi:LOW QUALITY PROTEIN: NAC domain [Dillenia turbinata]|uniref:NAC domain n=1 Tax=Dillenia turbinata TaxID=194707 RepID=A0AAN8UVN5_9MAGN
MNFPVQALPLMDPSLEQFLFTLNVQAPEFDGFVMCWGFRISHGHKGKTRPQSTSFHLMMDGPDMSNGILPPGVRFYPTDHELIIHYLKEKISNPSPGVSIIADINLYRFNPWELPEKLHFGNMSCFSSAQEIENIQMEPVQTAQLDLVTGKPLELINLFSRPAVHNVLKALVFYKGRPPKGTKTDWVKREYRFLKDACHSQWLSWMIGCCVEFARRFICQTDWREP